MLNNFIETLCLSFTCRGFNDAINGFNDDGWSIMNCDGTEDVIIAINSSKSLSSTSNPANALSFLGGVLCAKASMLLQVSFRKPLKMGTHFLIIKCRLY